MTKNRQTTGSRRINLNNTPIPTHIFVDRTLSVLEALTEYLKESKNMTYHEIAVLLDRDDRTIWTCYHRSQIKRSKKQYNSGTE